MFESTLKIDKERDSRAVFMCIEMKFTLLFNLRKDPCQNFRRLNPKKHDKHNINNKVFPIEVNVIRDFILSDIHVHNIVDKYFNVV